MEIGFLRHEKILPELSLLLSESGLKTVYFPLVNYQAIEFEISTEYLKTFTGIILCSKRAVEIFFSKCSPKSLNNQKIYCVGERAKNRLISLGLKQVKHFSNFIEMSNSLIKSDCLLYPASNKYSQQELEIAKNKCTKIEVLKCYEVVYTKECKDFQEWLLKHDVKGLAVLAPSQAEVLKNYESKNVHTFCMGSRTKARLEELKIENIHLSKEPNMVSLIDSCQKYFKS